VRRKKQNAISLQEVSMSNRNKPSIVIGSLLIAFGVLVFLGEIFKSTIFHFWPLFIVAAGLLFFVAMVVAGKSTGFLAIPGSIIVMIGLILFYQALTNRWETWAYAWALIPLGVGIGMWIFGKFSDLPELCDSGRHVINVGLILFVVFGIFFELLIGISGANRNNELLWPLALVAVGVYLLFSRLIWKGGSGSNGGAISMKIGGDYEVVEPTDSAPSETRKFTGLTGVHQKGVGVLLITQGDKDELRIEASPEIRERIITEVKDGILVIRHDNDFVDWLRVWTHSADPLRFFLTIRDIRTLKLSGAGKVKAPAIKGDSLEMINSGAGSQSIDDLAVNAFKVELSGAGSMDVAGKVNEQTVKLSGAGSYNAAKLESRSAEVKLSGVGSATVWASEILDVNLSGIGSVEYYGGPQVTKKVSGLGSLKALGAK
jgi:predicted tellurium resistance membrane protein TerC